MTPRSSVQVFDFVHHSFEASPARFTDESPAVGERASSVPGQRMPDQKISDRYEIVRCIPIPS
jgi:hypothetical protein